MMTSTIQDNTVYGSIEAGGTKWVCAIGSGPDDLRAETRFPTTTSTETLARAIGFFQDHQHLGQLKAIGVGSFGPVDLNPTSATYGYITSTPKAGWANTDVAGPIRQALGVPVRVDTDVNAAALGEYRWGAAQGCTISIYITVGTGIGGGGVAYERRLHGLIHPEMGHIRIPHDWQRDPFRGNCPYHGDCLEGLASGAALAERWGQPAETLATDHPAWDLQARYLALALVNLICTLSPERIIIGGGVMEQAHLFPLIRAEVQQLLNGYVQAPAILGAIDRYIVAPALGNRAGIVRGIALAAQDMEHLED